MRVHHTTGGISLQLHCIYQGEVLYTSNVLRSFALRGSAAFTIDYPTNCLMVINNDGS